jgi:zinc/manganese transport system substrate-binding protein
MSTKKVILWLFSWLVPLTLQAHSCKVVTSFSILQDMVKAVTGTVCEVITLVGPNQDAHIFEPKPSTASLLVSADLVIINGLGFEGWMERLLKAADYQGPQAIATRYVTPRYVYMPQHPTATKVPDPHAWHTIPNALLYLRAITESLSQTFPMYASLFQKNAARYQKQLQTLEEDIQQQLQTLSPHKRRVITAHDAFGYMEEHYQIHFMSPVGLSTEAEPSAKQVAELVTHIQHANIRALFIENIANEKLIRQLAEETGITISGKLYSDALSEEKGPAATYIDMMRYNIQQLIAAMRLNP